MTKIRGRIILALLLSQIMALIWWAAAYAWRGADVIPVWHDQSITFARLYDLAHPPAPVRIAGGQRHDDNFALDLAGHDIL